MLKYVLANIIFKFRGMVYEMFRWALIRNLNINKYKDWVDGELLS